VSNLVAAPFVGVVNIAGQIHDRIRGFPPGTPIRGVRIEE